MAVIVNINAISTGAANCIDTVKILDVKLMKKIPRSPPR